MNKEIGTYELIQNFLNGKLTGDALKEFESRLSREKDFGQYVQSHKAANLLIRNKELNSIKNELQSIHNLSLKSGRNWKPLLGVLFGLTLLILIWIFSANLDFRSKKTIQKHEAISREVESPKKEVSRVDNGSIETVTIVEDKSEIRIGGKGGKSEIGLQTEAESWGNNSRIISNIELKSISLESLALEKRYIMLPPAQDKIGDLSANNTESGKVICKTYSVSLDLVIHPSCVGKGDGRVKIQNEEYAAGCKFQIDGMKPQSAMIFSGLVGGAHDIHVIDERECKSLPYKFDISELNCEIIIHQSQNVFWEIPPEITRGKEVDLEIYDANSGALVFKQKLDSYNQNIWDGRGTQGQLLPMGAYIYVYLRDGVKSKGDITILQ